MTGDYASTRRVRVVSAGNANQPLAAKETGEAIR